MRRGFTLIELLVVVGVIAVLAGLLFPALGLVKKQVNNVKCGNSLRQLAVGIEAYRQDHNDRFPGSLQGLFTASGEYFERGLNKILLCPLDASRGQDGTNRPAAWDSDPSVPQAWQRDRPASYLYEAGDNPLSASLIAYFFENMPAAERPAAATWGEAKIFQKHHGNVDPATGNAIPFPGDYFPLVRCFWHQEWAGNNSDRGKRKVQNISWDYNVFWSTPWWEIDVNPQVFHY